ncbi:MAG: hypothetical protein IJN90_05805 [Bacilli bacterium]|nr:hypothetical protein [Bacilli bacterium]
MANGDFAKRHAGEERVVTPAKKDFEGYTLRDSESTRVQTSKGMVTFKKALVTAVKVGAVLALAATGFGALQIAAIAVRPDMQIISFETIPWAIMTWAGFKASKATVPAAMRNSERFKPYYDAAVELTEGKTKKKK